MLTKFTSKKSQKKTPFPLYQPCEIRYKNNQVTPHGARGSWGYVAIEASAEPIVHLGILRR